MPDPRERASVMLSAELILRRRLSETRTGSLDSLEYEGLSSSIVIVLL